MSQKPYGACFNVAMSNIVHTDRLEKYQIIRQIKRKQKNAQKNKENIIIFFACWV